MRVTDGGSTTDHMTSDRARRELPPRVPWLPKGWREEIRADLAAQLEAGGTLYGTRADGAYIARTKDGDRVIRPPKPKAD